MSPQVTVREGCKHVVVSGNEPRKNEDGKLMPTGKPGRFMTSDDGPFDVSDAELEAFADKLVPVRPGGKPAGRKNDADAAG